MSECVNLQASDGHQLDAYVAHPEGEPIAGLVIVQEIFVVNRHIRSVADGYAKDGFLAVAPALFDRYERGLVLGYEGEDMQKAMSLVPQLNLDHALLDTAAALEYARQQTGKKCGVIGYCYGGTITWLAASRLGADAAVGYYGGRPVLERYRTAFRIQDATLARGEELFARYGAVTIFFARFVFGMRIIAGPLAGVLRMPWRKFTVFNFLGAAVWVTVISGAGYLFGQHLSRLERDIRLFDVVAAILVLMGLGLLWWRSHRERS